MTTARDIMTPSPRCFGEGQTLTEAAEMLAELDVGALPICGADEKLKGMLTDRDIVVKCIARGGDPRTQTAGEFATGTPVYVHADDDVSRVLSLMQEHQVRRMPVIEDQLLVGIVSQADVALAMAPRDTGQTVERISL